MKKQLIFGMVLGIIIFGFGSLNSAVAIVNQPIDITSLGDEVGIVWAASNGNEPSVTIIPSDLGVSDVGTLPTSPFYFFKEWGRGIQRFFTFNSVAKAELELNITNQIAAEVIEVEKAKPDDADALKKALGNYTDAQERLNSRITTINGTSNVVDSEKLLKDVDDKTAKHVVLLEQVSARVTFTRTGTCGAFCQQYEDLQSVVDDALNNTQETFTAMFTVTVTPVNDAPTLKQKAEEQIKRAEIAVVTVDVVSPTGGEVNLRVTVPKQTQGATFGEKTNAIGTFNGLMIGTTAVINGGDLLISVTTTAGLAVGDIIRIDNELMLITKITPTSITVQRGANGSTAGAHLSGAIIYKFWTPIPSYIVIARAKSNLDNAKKSFADGKYGEAYGLARSAEVIAIGINGTKDLDNQAAGKEYGNKTAPTVSPKQSPKVESPSPSPKPSASPSVSPTTRPTPEKTETPVPESAGSPAL